MRTNILSLALISLLGLSSALPTGSRLAKRDIPEPVSAQNDDTRATAQMLPRAAQKPGIAYAPLKKDRGCKSAQEVANDFKTTLKDYRLVRLYGVECRQVATALEGAKKHGMKLFLGLYESEPNKIAEEFKSMKEQLKDDWSLVDTVSFGNENVDRLTNIIDRKQRVAKVLAGLAQTRQLLKGTNFKGKVVAIDTWVNARDNPVILENSDYCAVNFHPFFDRGGQMTAERAGGFIKEKIQTDLKPLCGNKPVVITETGWPHAGNPHEKAVPGMQQQAQAINSIKKSLAPENLILFSPFDDEWKEDNANTWGAEKFWGIGGKKSG